MRNGGKRKLEEKEKRMRWRRKCKKIDNFLLQYFTHYWRSLLNADESHFFLFFCLWECNRNESENYIVYWVIGIKILRKKNMKRMCNSCSDIWRSNISNKPNSMNSVIEKNVATSINKDVMLHAKQKKGRNFVCEMRCQKVFVCQWEMSMNCNM